MDARTSVDDAVQTAIAVCGCGHDGRLGMGSGAPSALHEITLLDNFFSEPSHGGDPSSPSSPSQPFRVSGKILQVACGAYHTLVLTTAGLYGWGAHEQGQLGLGRPSNAASPQCAVNCEGDAAGVDGASVPSFYEQPTPIPLPRLPGGGRGADAASGHPTPGAEAQGEIVSVHCGADHSILRTTAAVYVTGRNDCGQLGLGHMEAVYTWAFLCWVAAPLLSLPSAIRVDGSCARLIQGKLTHVSCGTHHTLLAWSNALMLHSTADEGASAQQCRLFFYPAVLLACGRGDFGELGYDGDAWAVLQAKMQRQERALLAEAMNQQKRGLSPSAVGDPDAATGTAPYKFKWKAAAAVKQRRPPFSSPFLQCVEVHELPDCEVELPAVWAGELSAALAHDDFASEGSARLSPSISDSLQQFLERCTASSARDTATAERRRWEVVSLQAMHHHSAVTLRECSSSSSDSTSTAPLLVLHWGCYYCSEIEDAAASIPRPLLSDHDKGKVDVAAKHPQLGICAGDETLFRYNIPVGSVGADAAVLTAVQVMGTGNLGRGSDDDVARTWVDVPLPLVPEPNLTSGAPCCVRSMSGRTHILITVSSQASPSSEEGGGRCFAVFGFGENLHGQLGAPPARCNADLSGDHDDNAVLAPRPVLQRGDTLRTASAVKKSLQEAANSLSHHHRGEKGEPEAASADQWVVERIRAAGAGARHSVFVVDVRPLKTSSS
ncbi:putative chromatin binding protein [Leptomonas seymouri]|uniref:Putative chromatin binding protein n=1 Tax=Leptomonas seymouri TaxID=5684 RepID=A0A0N1I0Q9_LEPSE|nr:putative chromatin binding protein [Leptomonas seymouri]|eukprot:KPI83602.1 putative chromatin binding protein [Leptomonas seymouri]